jgi:hypothetical protein
MSSLTFSVVQPGRTLTVTAANGSLGTNGFTDPLFHAVIGSTDSGLVGMNAQTV